VELLVCGNDGFPDVERNFFAEGSSVSSPIKAFIARSSSSRCRYENKPQKIKMATFSFASCSSLCRSKGFFALK
jgi:hypothetical protein